MGLKTLIDRGIELFAEKQPREAPQINQGIALLPEFNIGKAAPKVFDYKNFGDEGYRKNVVIFAGITSIATSMAQLGFKLSRTTKGGTKEKIDDPDHPLMVLLRDPVNSSENPEISGVDFQEMMWTDYEIAGNYFMLISRGGGGDPARLDLLRPDWVNPIVESDGTIKTYRYQIDGFGKTTDFPASDIIHLKNHPDYTNRWLGLSAIAIMVRQAMLDEKIADFMLGLMLNSGIPGMILRKKQGDWTKDQKDDIRQQIAMRVTGKNAGSTFIMGEDWELAGQGQTPKQMDTSNFITYAEQRILAALGVPPIVIGVAAGVLNMTYDNFEHAKRLWWEDKLIPKSVKGQAKLQQLADNFEDGLVLEYDYSKIPALKEKMGEDQKHLLEMYKVDAITRNELRTGSYMEPIEADGKEGVFYSSLMPSRGGFGFGDNTQTFRKALPPARETQARPRTNWKDLRRIADAATPQLRKEILRGLTKVKGGVDLSAMEKALRANDIEAAMKAVPWEDFGEFMTPKAEDLFQKVIVKAAGIGADSVPGDFAFNVENPLATKWAKANAAKLVTNVDTASRDAIKNSVVKALQTEQDWKAAAKEIRGYVGLTDPQIKSIENQREDLLEAGYEIEEIEGMLGTRIEQMIRYRSDMIARTESIDAANRGQEAAWESAMEEGWLDPRTAKREWIAGPNPCEDCAAIADADPVGLDEEFPEDGGEGPPLHPNCNCGEGLVIE